MDNIVILSISCNLFSFSCMHAQLGMFVCLCTSGDVLCLLVCAYLKLYVNVYEYMHACVHVNVRACKCACMCMRVCMHIYMRVCMHVISMRACVYFYTMHTYLFA